MNRLLFVTALLLMLASCAMEGGKIDYQKELGAVVKFHHRSHKVFIDEHGCIPCHEMNVKMDWADIELAERGSKKIIMPSKVTCHYCHNNPEGLPYPQAPTKCYICHLNLEEIKPRDHLAGNWLKIHRFAYYGDSKGCGECHRQKFCIDCHARRDVIQHLVHPRNYEYTHSIDASADPGRCGRCHRIGFCTECHTKGTWAK